MGDGADVSGERRHDGLGEVDRHFGPALLSIQFNKRKAKKVVI